MQTLCAGCSNGFLPCRR